MFKRNRSAHVRWLKYVAVIFCLVPMFLSQTRMVPTLLAAAAMLEGSHTVLVAGAHGETRVVLSHERGNANRADADPHHRPTDPSHRHGLASNLLCAFAAPAPGEADHVARFASHSHSGAIRSSFIPLTKLSPGFLMAARLSDSWPNHPLALGLDPLAPRASSAVLLGISTALLI